APYARTRAGVAGAEELWTTLDDEPIGPIAEQRQAEDPEIDNLVDSPRKLLAFRTFAYIRVGILLGKLLVDHDVPDYDGTETWVDALLKEPRHREAVAVELRAVAEEVSRSEEPEAVPVGPDDEARERFREFARKQLGEVRIALAAALAAGRVTAGGAAAPGPPSASARAWAVRVLVPGRQPVGTAVVTGAPGGERQVDAAFAFPENGSVVRTGQATAIVASGRTAASGASSVGRVAVFGGEIVARTVNGVARGGETSAGFDGTAVVGLPLRGKPAAKQGLALGSWG